MSLRHFLTCLDSDEYQTLGFLIFPYSKHVWFIGCEFNTPYPTCAFLILWPCITHSLLAHTFATLVMHWSIPCFFILACHVYIRLCSILFCLLFELHFSFILHPSCFILIVHTFILCPHFSLTLWLFVSKRGRVYFCHFYMTLVHILRGRNFISRAHL